MNKRKIAVFGLLFVSLYLLLAPEVMLSAASAQTAPTVSINIQNFAFSPATVTVTVGTKVSWTNKDVVEHTVTADKGSFKSDLIAENKTFTYTFNQPGTFSYHCEPHPFMTAQIVVIAAGNSTTTAVNSTTTVAPATTTAAVATTPMSAMPSPTMMPSMPAMTTAPAATPSPITSTTLPATTTAVSSSTTTAVATAQPLTTTQPATSSSASANSNNNSTLLIVGVVIIVVIVAGGAFLLLRK